MLCIEYPKEDLMVVKGMVEGPLIKEEAMVEDTVDVIRLRGGGGPGSGRKRKQSDTTYEVHVATAGLRVSARRTVTVYAEDDPNAPISIDVLRMMRTMPLLYTAYSYIMHPSIWCGTNGADYMIAGIGPALYWQHVIAIVDGVNLNTQTGRLKPFTTPTVVGNSKPVNCEAGTIYVFAADWIGSQMNPDGTTQSGSAAAGCELAWSASKTTVTTDPNTPITVADLMTNKDWSRITHFCTWISMDFTNLAPFPYIVEVLFFKFNVGVADMNMQDMQNAPYCNQYQQVDAYCRQNVQQFGTPQIQVLKRKRIKIFGMDNTVNTADSGAKVVGLTQLNAANGNTARYNFRIKRIYHLVRGIKANEATEPQTEKDLFVKYYDADKGVFCRIQAWPEEALYDLPGTDITEFAAHPRINDLYNEACRPTTAKSQLRLRPAVQCHMEKRTFLKVDQPILKGPNRTT